MTVVLQTREHETGTNPLFSVIWLHGLGADGNDFAPIVPELSLPPQPDIRFVFPHAPHIPVTVNGGFIMPAWYDIMEMHIERRVDVDGLLRSAASVRQLVEREIGRGIESRRIVLAGFSQGGAVAYQTALSFEQPLGGLLAMSSYLATSESIELHPANRDLPIEIHHGMHDPVVPERLGEAAQRWLERQGFRPGYRTYPMEHGVCPQQLDDIGAWLTGIINAGAASP